jgi:ribonuclease HII
LCGVDEAGKGAVLGPLVVAAVGAADHAELEKIGVKDSKLLLPARRKELSDLICSMFPFRIFVIEAAEIDLLRKQMNMNAIMARAHARVITDLGASVAYVDACDVNEGRYGSMVKNSVGCDCRIISEHHADTTWPLVSAASIVAKVFRDEAIEELRSTFGEIGSGYPSDKTTVAFLEEYLSTFGKPPICARASWQTTRTLIATKEQAHLSSFFG